MKSSANPVVVLLVEDEPLVRLDTAESLEELGFEVIAVADADSAVELLEEHGRIAVVFSDVNMPGSLDGLALAHLVRERWPDICVILTSGRVVPGPDDLPQCGRFIAKPYQPAQVASVMQQLLNS